MSIWPRIGMLTSTLLFFISAPTHIASADDMHSANAYLAGCKILVEDDRPRSPEIVFAARCLGFVQAARGYTLLLPDPFRSCTPVSVTNNQVALVILKFLENNPSRLHESFLLLVIEALKNAWPCKS